MKKSLFILPVAALAMAACSSDTVTNDAQRVQLGNADQLTIVPAVQGSTTRATSMTTSTLPSFNINIEGKFQKGEEDATLWGNGVQTITRTGSSWNFPTGVQYWWADKSTNAKFTAWAPIGLTENNATAEGAIVTVDDNIANQVDVLAAYNEGIREDFTTGVPMNFQHVMSQIVVKALNKNPNDIEVKVAGMKLMNIKNSGTLALPTKSTAKGEFSWDDYTPWSSLGGSAAYKNGATESITVSSGETTLTASAKDLADPMLLMPQQLEAQALDATSNLTKNYLAVLVKITTKKQYGYRDPAGHYYKGDPSNNENAIPFTAKRNSTDTENNTYTAKELKALENGTIPTYNSGDTEEGAVTNNWGSITTIYKATEVLYPREGFGTTSDKYAYVGVALDTEWKPGYKYVYTLNFSKDGVGKSIADQPADAAAYNNDHPTYNFPYGKNYETGEADVPGEDIVDNPTQLFFTVTVDEWTNADAIGQDM